MKRFHKTCIALTALAAATAASPGARTKLAEWERGVVMERLDQKDMAMFLWFYEWNMFEAIRRGADSSGTWDLPRTFSADGSRATVTSHMMQLTVLATANGADLSLKVTNRSQDKVWPEIAGVIPCFNPGRKEGTSDTDPGPKNAQFGDLQERKTYFLGPQGLALLDSRAIHFNERLRPLIDREGAAGPFRFSEKWPTSEVNAKAGILIRESEDGQWVAGIGWEDFLSVQAHNPWHCMHLAVRVGPLKPMQTKIIRGKMYLFRGNRDDCLARFRKDFPG
jgi:hypothetical protein